ncbi:hypothetical protein ANCCAN_20058 [Ancylostoma caninum]|uniref:Uncharacterized protein n=1 Tax=Ancylostoma caninum TaxID=29170 RepID=A0A368FRJ0_ANCCA|nr:hypothetical protein ANCCAN_20058 [Ancylostoma caninum]
MRSDVATRAQHYYFDGLDDTDESIREVLLFIFATKLQSDIVRAQLSKLHLGIEFTGKFTVPASRPGVSVNNCSKKSLIVEAEPPFVKITNPSHKIREFAVRVNRSGGSVPTYKTSPTALKQNFREDVIGLGHAELEDGVELDWEQSRSGRERKRAANVTTLTKQKVEWATHIFH